MAEAYPDSSLKGNRKDFKSKEEMTELKQENPPLIKTEFQAFI